MHIKKQLGFNGLRQTITTRLNKIENKRLKNKTNIDLHDFFMSGFAMMYFQDKSLLEFQRRMEEVNNFNNLKTMFKVQSIPKDTQMREVLDNTANDEIENLFSDFFRHLQRGKQLEQFEFMNNHYLIPIDGSGYFSSDKLSCPNCLTKTSSTTGKIRYEHQILQPIIASHGQRQVIPLAPEAIQNTDGSSKQDCEINAGKRVLKKIRKAHPKLKIIITADDLYSKQPFVDELKINNMSYILVAKPTDHKILFEWVNEQKQLKGSSNLTFKDDKGRKHKYEWINEIPLNGTKDADNVNFFEYTISIKDKVSYYNSWVTDINISKKNNENLVKGGRAKWKIENEGFNTLKNQGYHIEHNFGHGKKNLSFTFFLLNLLAFFMHQILELCDDFYQKCRQKFSARKEYWNQLRCTFRILIFKDWYNMIGFIIKPPTEEILQN